MFSLFSIYSSDSPNNQENSHETIDLDVSDDTEEEQLIKKIEEKQKSEAIEIEQNAEDLVAQFQNDLNEAAAPTTATTIESEAGPSSNNVEQQRNTTNSNARQYGRSLRSKFFTTRKYRSRTAAATATANNITDSDDDSDDDRTNNDNVPSGATSSEARRLSTSPVSTKIWFCFDFFDFL